MKIKLDENLPASLARDLADLGHDADTVPDEGLTGFDDESVWEAAQREKRFVITQDLDFSDARRFRPGEHSGVLLVRLHRPAAAALRARVRAVFQDEDVESWKGCLVVLTASKLRVRSPT